MGQSKQRKRAVHASATQYFEQIGLVDEAQRAWLEDFFVDTDHLLARLLALAEQNLRATDKGKIFVHLSPESSLSPKATGQPPDYFRIEFPMSLLHRLWLMASTCDMEEAGLSRMPSNACASIAALMAFGHELNHVFTGHVDLDPDRFQESNSDFRAGGLVAGWFRRDDIRQKLSLDTATEDDLARSLVLAAVTLCLIFGPATPGHTVAANYPIPETRFRLLLAGYIYYREAIGADLMATQVALDTAHTWVPQALTPLGLTDEARALIEGHAPQHERVLEPAAARTREHWYRHSLLLRPIIKSLLAVVRRDAKEGR
ncbi:Uncharacterised protein [Burkholderia pseudomallei]|uniref:hypothetical protein n=1 Tax=Burkholderia pseudomallei TaxID=28450 RepID=UPI0005DD2332|nr:hypothetical protein [Burkholderia pseudomallei]CAK1327845.1 Uncharacterised protein [Burkholderia pseudomallei]CAK1343017.1 Uncharacterised protein [Burkholderia pseudomallei]